MMDWGERQKCPCCKEERKHHAFLVTFVCGSYFCDGDFFRTVECVNDGLVREINKAKGKNNGR